MHHTTRTLLILIFVAVAGVGALGYGAYRYARILEGRMPSTTSLERRVDAFIEVRRGMRSVIDGWGGGPAQADALMLARDRAILMNRVDPGEYAAVRRQYRAWRAGQLRAGTPMAAALERRRQELARVDLGSYESLDS
jgi:hypothetical protein